MSAEVIRRRDDLRRRVGEARRRGETIGLVPTMGALHEGHLSLIRAAADRCDLVVVSVFVNPTQFGPGEDLDRYPRQEARDVELAGDAGAAIVYAPSVAEVYPEGFATTVRVDRALTGVLCGEPSRRGPEHFDGVCTVVVKLVNAADPDVAFFGAKDGQQAIVIKRMARDLDLRTEISVQPTVREADGLAMSSRNAYLSPAERTLAPLLRRALVTAAEAAAGSVSPAEAIAAAQRVLGAKPGIELEYLEARDAEDLMPVGSFADRPVLIALAARIGSTRLIDNVVTEPVAAAPSSPTAPSNPQLETVAGR